MDHPALFYLRQDLARRLHDARQQAARHLEAAPREDPEYAWAKALERHMGDFAYHLPMFLYDQGLTEEFSEPPQFTEVIVQVKQAESPNPARKGESHRVQSGDTLGGIARQYGITLAALYEVNPDLKAQDPRKLAVGTEVILPYGAPFGIKARIDLLIPMHEYRMIELAYHLGLIERITGLDLLDLNYYRYGLDPKQWFQSKQSYQQDGDSPRDNWSTTSSRDSSQAEHPQQRGPWDPSFLNKQQQKVGELGQKPCRFRHQDLVSAFGISLSQPIITANRHIQEASPKQLEELISTYRRRPYQLVLEAPDVLTGINHSMSNTASFIFNLGANAWNGIAMSINYSYAVMTGAEKNISGAEAIYQLEQYIKADYGHLINNPKDYFYESFTNLENYEDAAAALIAGKLAPKGPSKPNIFKKSTGAVDMLNGSGPVPGVIEVSARVKSVKQFLNWNANTGVEFIFDIERKIFVMGKAEVGFGSPHQKLAQAIGSTDNKNVVGGIVSKKNGEFVFNEHSGHFGENWTPENRQLFSSFMKDNTGINVNNKGYNPSDY